MVGFEAAGEVLLREGLLPDLPPATARELRRFWEAKRAENDALFDGPVLLALSARRVEGRFEVEYATSSYSRLLWHRDHPGDGDPSSLYVGVIASTDEGRLMAGRMSAQTSTPDRLQLCGGALEPVEGALRTTHAAEAARREFGEEMGLELRPRDLSLTHVKWAGASTDVGLFFTPNEPVGSTAAVCRAFDDLSAVDEARGFSEFSKLVLIEPGRHADDCEPARVDYLDRVVALSLDLDTPTLRYGPSRPLTPRCDLLSVSPREVVGDRASPFAPPTSP